MTILTSGCDTSADTSVKYLFKIENMKEFLDYLEYKERDAIIPKVKDVLFNWDENISNLEEKLDELSKKF